MDVSIPRTTLTARAFRWTLALVFGFSLLPLTAQGQQATTHDHDLAVHGLEGAGLFVLEVAEDGSVMCKQADPVQAAAMRSAPGAESLNFTVFTSTNGARDLTDFRILLRATDQLLEFPAALLAFRRAAARWERRITTPITVIFDVDYGPERFDQGPWSTGVLGSTSSAQQVIDGVGPAEIVAKLKAQNTGDAQLQALYDGIPIPTPSTVGENLDLAIINYPVAQVHGYLPANPDLDPIANPFGTFPTIGFNSGFNYDFETSDGIASGFFDFDGVAVHEMGHALGFVSAIGYSGGNNPNYFSTWDLFRVRPEAVTPGEDLDDGAGWEVAPRVLTPGPSSGGGDQVFFDGLKELEVSTATGGRQGGDGQQASHWRDDAQFGGPKIGIMDPNLGTGSRDELNDNDLRALEVQGWTVNYEPDFVEFAVTVNGESYDVTAPDSVEFLDLGDIAGSEDLTLDVVLTNESTTTALDYSAEVSVEAVYPAEVTPNFSLNSTAGSVAASGSETITMTANLPDPTVVYGILRIETNVDDALVFDVPFRFSVGGARAPRLDVVTEGPIDLGDFDQDGLQTGTLLTIENEGTIDLRYRTAISSARRGNVFPIDTDPAGRGLGEEPLFFEDFEDGTLGSFEAGGSFPGDWQVVDIGPATLPGHSTPNAAYFGENRNGLQYRNLAQGILISPAIDVSGLPQEDVLALSFNYYLEAEPQADDGTIWDFASVLYSIDDGETFTEIATNNGGIIENRTEAWENIEIEIPLLAGYPEPVRFAFQFQSDQLVTDLGWLIDDVTVFVKPDQTPFFVTPVAGSLDGEAQQEITFTVRADAFDRGFYRGEINIISNSLEFSDAGIPVGTTRSGKRILEVTESVPFTFTLGDPGPPELTVVSAPASVSVAANESTDGTVEISNAGDAELDFVRLMEPALSLLDGSTSSPDDPSAAAARDSLYSIEIPGATSNVAGITQLGDGRVVVVDGSDSGRTYVLSEDLSMIEETLEGFIASTESIAGVIYNEATQSLWFAVLPDAKLVEATLGDSAVEPTGETIDLSAIEGGVGGTAYSAGLDAIFVAERNSDLVYAIGADGKTLPGYPVQARTRGGLAPALSITDGVLEVLDDNLSYVQLDQFGELFPESEQAVVERDRLGSAARINAMHRSTTRPDDVIYYLTRRGGGVVRVVAENPTDLPDYTTTSIEAAEPLYASQLGIGASETLSLRIDGKGRAPGTYNETLAFLTNAPEDRIITVAILVEITPSTSAEDGLTTPTAFALRPNYPNPFTNSTQLVFDLPTAVRVSLSVYDVLGKRVAVLADAEMMEAGAQHVPFDASQLASGTYIVRLQAGEFAATQRLTVVR